MVNHNIRKFHLMMVQGIIHKETMMIYTVMKQMNHLSCEIIKV